MERYKLALQWAGYTLTELLARAILCPEAVWLLARKLESELVRPRHLYQLIAESAQHLSNVLQV